MSNLTKLEHEVLRMLLEGDDEVLMSLKAQLDFVSVKNREMSSAGFYTNLIVSKSSKAGTISSNTEFKIGDVHADIEGLEFGAGFVLYVEGGVIKMLEAYSYDEPWPVSSDNYTLTYVNGKRDFEALKASWS